MSETTDLTLLTRLSRRTREGFKPMPVPHAAIYGIVAGAGQDRMTRGYDRTTIHLSAVLADRLIAYKNRYFAEDSAVAADVNCAHFIHFMKGKPIEGAFAAAAALDEITGSVVQPDNLALGHVGVIAAAGDIRDQGGLRHFLHAGISVGGGRWLDVTGLNADLAASTISDSLRYYRDQAGVWYGSAAHPDTIHLYDNGMA